MREVTSSELRNKIGPTIDRVIAGQDTAVTRGGRVVVVIREIDRDFAQQHELQMLRQAVAYLNTAITGEDWPGDKTTLALPVPEMVKLSTEAVQQALKAREQAVVVTAAGRTGADTD